MGLRGIIVAGLAGKDRRDFLASEARQRASLHRLPTFAVFVLDGAVRRKIASPVASVLAALAGREVAIVMDPPALVFNEPEIDLAPPPRDLVRVRAGERVGREGRWAGLAGLRRFADGTFLEAGWVAFEGWPPGAGPAGRPRAVRLRRRRVAASERANADSTRQAVGPWATLAPMSVPTALERQFISSDPATTRELAARLAGCRPTR